MYRKHAMYFDHLSAIHYHIGDPDAKTRGPKQTFEFKVFRCGHCDQEYSLDEADLMKMPTSMAKCPKSPDRATIKEWITGTATVLKQSQRDIDGLAQLDRLGQNLRNSVAPKKDTRNDADVSLQTSSDR